MHTTQAIHAYTLHTLVHAYTPVDVYPHTAGGSRPVTIHHAITQHYRLALHICPQITPLHPRDGPLRKNRGLAVYIRRYSVLRT